jgi:hypothetical protein
MVTPSVIDPNLLGKESSLSNWAGPYVTNMLGQGQALAGQPYAAYEGPLTAGTSPLQQQAFSGIAGLSLPSEMTQAGQAAGQAAQTASGLSYGPNTFQGGIFGTQQAQQYMNPYLQAALEPQLQEARRQAEISRMGEAGRLTQAGAYGGSRQAIMESEGDRNLQSRLSDITGTGYSNAYQQAMQQFNADQARRMEADRMGEQSSQFGAQYGLDALGRQLQGAGLQADIGRSIGDMDLRRLGTMADMGGIQRGIESEGVAADYAQFQQERDYPKQQVQFMQSLLQGLPLEAQSNFYAEPSMLAQILGGAGGGSDLAGIFGDIFGSNTAGDIWGAFKGLFD